jgi:voltage-gated potassium channel
VIFGTETPWGRRFDVVLIAAILGSVLAIILESVASIRAEHGGTLRTLEWGFTIAFTVEYLLRLWCVSRSVRYVKSFFGVIDLLAVLPTYISVLIPGGQVLTVVRILRVLRVFRVLKLVQFLGEAAVLATALRNSRHKIIVFLATIMTIVVIVGSLMYLVEGPAYGFTSIPRGIYWGVVTLTTVGFGDITPSTPVGQALATFVMIMGYGIIAVPTGIVTAELSQLGRATTSAACDRCGLAYHLADARYCRRCGERLTTPDEQGTVP